MQLEKKNRRVILSLKWTMRKLMTLSHENFCFICYVSLDLGVN